MHIYLGYFEPKKLAKLLDAMFQKPLIAPTGVVFGP